MSLFPDTDVYPGEGLYSSGIGGGSFSRGQTGLFYIGEETVVAAYLGDLLIWDGTVSAFVSIPAATATATALAPVVSSTPGAITIPIATASASATAPAYTVSATIHVPAATATASAPVPTVSAAATIAVPVATASASALPPLSDATIAVPIATATATALPPILTVTGSAAVLVPAAGATATALDPTVHVSATIAVPIATASAAARTPAVSSSRTVTVPIATASAAALAPTVAVTVFAPSGMTKNSTQTWQTSATWVAITSWAANTTTYPGSTVTTDRLVVQGAKTNATLSASIPYTGGIFSRGHTARLVNQSGAVIATGATVTADSGTCTVTATNVNLSGITSVGVQMNSTGSNAGTVTSGSTCFLTIT